MKLNRTKNEMDREARNHENENWNRLEKLSKEVDDLVLESGGDSNLEVVQARGGEPVLNDRLNKLDQELADKAGKDYVDKGLLHADNRISELRSQLTEDSVRIGNWIINKNADINALDFRLVT